MNILTIDYRVIVYDTDDVTPLTPIGGAAHSDPFQYSTCAISGYKAYMLPQLYEPKQSLDRLTGRTELDEDTIRLQDAKTGTDNLTRHVTAFLGDALGRNRLQGLKYKRQQRETINGVPGAWEDYFTGRVATVSAPSPSQNGAIYTITARTERAAEKRDIFVGVPHHSITYASPSPLFPIGVQNQWGFAQAPDINCFLVTLSDAVSGRRMMQMQGTDSTSILSRVGPRYALTKALQTRADFRLRDANGLEFCPHVRVRLTHLTGAHAGETGDYFLSPATSSKKWTGYDGGQNSTSPLFVYTQDDKTPTVFAFGVKTLPSTHPQYLPLPAAGVQCTGYLFNAGPPTPDAPLLIDDVNSVQLAADVYAGKFSALNDSGTSADPGDGEPIFRAIPTDSTTFSALSGDSSIAKFRGAIEKIFKASDFLQWLTQTSHVFFRSGADGEAEAVDVRTTSTSTSGLTTIGNDDVISASWDSNQDTIGRLTIVSYNDQKIANFDTSETEAMTVPAHGYRAAPSSRTFLSNRATASDATDLTIDAIGVRHYENGSSSVRSDIPFASESQSDSSREKAIATSYLHIFGDGAAYATLECRRTSNTKNLKSGSFTLVNVDAIPNLASNTRGGIRAMLVVSAQRTRTGIQLRALDLGANSIAVAPVVATPVQDATNPKHGVTIAVTPNVSGELAIVEVAYTSTATAVRPTTGWVAQDSFQNAGTLSLQSVPASKRVWVRGGSVTPNKLPSPYAYPAGTGYVDTASLTAPSGLTAAVDALTVALTWTNGEADCAVMPTIDGVDVLTRPLPAGSTRFVFEDLTAATTSAFGVRHIDAFGGSSAVTAVSATSGTAGTLAAPSSIELAQGNASAPYVRSPDGSTLQLASRYGFQLLLTYSDVTARARVEVSKLSDFSVVERTIETTDELVTVEVPLTSDRYYFRWYQIKAGWTDSAASATISAYPVPMFRVIRSQLEAAQNARIDVDPYLTPAAELHASVNVTSKYHSFRWSVSNASFPGTAASAPVAITPGTSVDLNAALTLATGETGYLTLQFFTDALGLEGASELVRKLRTNSTASLTSGISYLKDLGGTSLLAEVYGRATDPLNEGGTLKVWVNKSGDTSPDFTGAPDGTLAIASTPHDFGPTDDFTVGMSTNKLLHQITKRPGKTKTVYAEFVSTSGRSSGIATCVLDDTLEMLINTVGQLQANSIINAQQFAEAFRPYLILQTNTELAATTGVEGDLAYVVTTGVAYRWTSGHWDSSSASATYAAFPLIQAGAIVTTYLAAGAVDATIIAANAINAGHISAGAVTAAKISIGSLDELTDDAGIIVHGALQGANVTIDLDATGTNPIISSANVVINANGSATIGQMTITAGGSASYAGALNAASGTFAGSLSAATGTFAGSLSAATGTFAGNLSAAGGTFAGTLSAVGGTFGTITAGVLSGASVTVNLNATGSTAIISATNVSILASGAWTLGQVSCDAAGNTTFSGALSAASGTFAGTVSGGSFTAATAAFRNIDIGASNLVLASTVQVGFTCAGDTGSLQFTDVGTIAPSGTYGCTFTLSTLLNADISGAINATSLYFGSRQVSMGASNSGGAGFRQLLVPN